MKKKYIFIGGGVCIFLILLLIGGYVYMTKPNFRFINTRISEKDLGAQYVKIKMDNYETAAVSSNVESGNNITTDIEAEVSWEENTYQIDQQIQAELDSGNYSFNEPLVIQDPYQNSPLTAVVVYSGSESTSVRVTVKGKTAENDITDTLEASKSHIIPIIGLYSDFQNEVLLEELDDGGKVKQSKTLNIQTETLPEALREIVTVEQKSQDSGMELMVVTGGAAPYVYGFDSNGDVRWYLTNKTGATFGGYPLASGHFLIESEHSLMPTALKPHAAQFHEIDFLGRIYQDYFFTSGVHHELKEKVPGGNLLVVTDSGKGYAEDLIQEYDRSTGELVKELDLKEVFKDTGYVNKTDWAHVNTLSYDEATDSVIINPRNLHSGVKLNWSTNEIEWILGDPDFWAGTGMEDKVLKPVGDIQWHYQPHTVYQLAEGINKNPETIEVMLFDNHNDASRKVKGFKETGASYVKSYTIDPVKMTVQQSHIYECAYSSITSNFEFDYEKKRVFANSAYVAGDKKSGEITEYDFETEKVVNKYIINHNFYRGYLVKVDANSCMGKVNIEEAYLKGQLRVPVEVDTKVGKPIRTLAESSKAKISMTLLKDILLLSGQDHSFTQVIFAGSDHTYVYDVSDLKKRTKVSFVYALPIPLSGLKADTYQIYLMCYDEYFSLGQSFTISE